MIECVGGLRNLCKGDLTQSTFFVSYHCNEEPLSYAFREVKEYREEWKEYSSKERYYSRLFYRLLLTFTFLPYNLLSLSSLRSLKPLITRNPVPLHTNIAERGKPYSTHSDKKSEPPDWEAPKS